MTSLRCASGAPIGSSMLTSITSSFPFWAVISLVVTMAVSLYGLAALWATSARGGLLARVAPSILLLTALVPLGAYELIVLFGSQVLMVVGLIAGGRMGRAFCTARREGASCAAAWSAAIKQ